MILKAKFLETNDLNGCQCFSWITEQGVLTSDVRYFINKFVYLISLGKYFLGLINHIVHSHLVQQAIEDIHVGLQLHQKCSNSMRSLSP